MRLEVNGSERRTPAWSAAVAIALLSGCVPLGHSLVPREQRVWLGELVWTPHRWQCRRQGAPGAPEDEVCMTEERTPNMVRFAGIHRNADGAVVNVVRGWSTTDRAVWVALRDSVRTRAGAVSGAAPRCAIPPAGTWAHLGWRLPTYDLILMWSAGANLESPLYQVQLVTSVRRFYVCGPVRRPAA